VDRADAGLRLQQRARPAARREEIHGRAEALVQRAKQRQQHHHFAEVTEVRHQRPRKGDVTLFHHLKPRFDKGA
jgi:hypothetical protein